MVRDKRDEIEKWILEEGWLVYDAVHDPMGGGEALVMGDSRRTGRRGLVAKRASQNSRFHGLAADTGPEEVYLLDGDRIGLPDCIGAAACGAIHARGYAVGETQMVELPDYDLVLLVDPG